MVSMKIMYYSVTPYAEQWHLPSISFKGLVFFLYHVTFEAHLRTYVSAVEYFKGLLCYMSLWQCHCILQ